MNETIVLLISPSVASIGVVALVSRVSRRPAVATNRTDGSTTDAMSGAAIVLHSASRRMRVEKYRHRSHLRIGIGPDRRWARRGRWPVRAVLVGPIASPSFATSNAAARSQCLAGEAVVFSCAVKAAKVVSLCLRDGAAPNGAALSDRFGAPGKPELFFPSSAKDSLRQFRYAHYFRA